MSKRRRRRPRSSAKPISASLRAWPGKTRAALAKAIAAYEFQSDRMGRVGSFAYLNYVTNTADPARAKLFGDAQDKLTTISTQLLFFELELNRIGDEVMDAALRNRELAHYRPWLTDLRKERPYQLSDDLEKLFHEKSMTGPAAWSRLFNETLTRLAFRHRRRRLYARSRAEFPERLQRGETRGGGGRAGEGFQEPMCGCSPW